MNPQRANDPALTASPAPASGPGRVRRGFKLPAGLAAVLVLMLLGAGGWFVWWMTQPAAKVDLSMYEPIPTPAAQARARGTRERAVARLNSNLPGVVSTREDGGGEIRIGGARARFIKQDKGMRLDLQYTDIAFQPMPDRQAVMARFAAISDPERAKAANVTPEQVKQLRDVPYVREMVVPDSARQEMLDRWSAYTAAPADQKKGLEQAMSESFRKLAQESVDATAASVKQTADAVREILKPEQINGLRRRPG